MISGAIPRFILPDIIFTDDGDQAIGGTGATQTYSGVTTTGPVSVVWFSNGNNGDPKRDVTSVTIGGVTMTEIATAGQDGFLDGFSKIFLARGAFTNADVVVTLDGSGSNGAITYGSMQNNYDLVPVSIQASTGNGNQIIWPLEAEEARQIRLYGLVAANQNHSWEQTAGVRIANFDAGENRHYAGYAQTSDPTTTVTVQSPDGSSDIAAVAVLIK